MSRLPLGQLLLQAGVLSEEALQEVLELQRTAGRRLGDLLVERHLVPPRQLAQVISFQLSCPWLSLTNFEIPRELVELVPRQLAIAHTVVPVHVRESDGQRCLFVAMHDPTDEAAIEELARVVAMKVKPMVAITYEIRQALARYYGAPVPSLTTAPAPPARSPSPPPARPMPPMKPRKPSALPLRTPLAAVAGPAVAAEPKEATVLLLTVPSRFREQCAIAADRLGAKLVEGTLMNATEVAKRTSPIAIVVTEDVYAFDRSGLNRLGIETDALLVVWSEDVEADQLEPLLAGAMRRGGLGSPARSRR